MRFARTGKTVHLVLKIYASKSLKIKYSMKNQQKPQQKNYISSMAVQLKSQKHSYFFP